jgi:rhamnose transport system permease protein
MVKIWERLRSWEGLLLAILIVIVIMNTIRSPFYLRLDNQINLFQLSIEKIIVALIMALIIINGEIDLSVASVMGLAACTLAALHERGVPVPAAILLSLLVGAACGAFNGYWVAYVGLPSLAVTLAGLIGYRGLARVLLGDRSVGGFPEWFNALGQQPLIGPFPLALLLFFLLVILAVTVLQYSAFGRYVYVIGINRDVARYSAVKVQRLKMI